MEQLLSTRSSIEIAANFVICFIRLHFAIEAEILICWSD